MADVPKRKPEAPFNYGRYAGIGVQMVAIIVAGALGGLKLDQWANNTKPWFAVGLSVVAVALALYYFVKDLLR